ncbi:glycosyltransferase [Thalassospiraceae bacterium LMO-JJ14]|nr:glycosyltransferase [Thalassospiraceae bacterium LMO-JJ14]
MTLFLAALSLSIWVYLSLFHGRFWHSDQLLNINSVNIEKAPDVVCVIPARDEADSIGRTVRALLDQDYAGNFRIVVVDDNSTDGTADAARAALKAGESKRLNIIDGEPLAEGWVGKMWAVHQGIAAAGDATYILLTDADIEHAPDSLSRLVGKAGDGQLGLVSLMVKLRSISAWEKFLIPAFVYFFQKLYPFPRVNDPEAPIAAAAGGCMLVHADTLKAAGGIAEIRDQLIDDCALARLIKRHRPVWLGLAEETYSLRAYDDLPSIWNMVARSAYVQLKHNPLLLAGTLAGMGILYVMPPLAVLSGILMSDPVLVSLGATAWLVMAWTYLPTLDLYRLNTLWSLSLPFAGTLYALMTLDSARRHYAGQGGAWKGRTYS